MLGLSSQDQLVMAGMEDSMTHVVVSSNLLFDLFHFHVNQRVSEVVQVNTAKVVGQRLF